jgi:hypothetical protein
MKILLILAVITLEGVCASDGIKSTINRNEERLVPLTSFDEGLRSAMEEKLLVTSANCGRMIRMQGGDDVGESSVSVYCDNPEITDAVCHVTTTKALGSFDYVMSAHQDEPDPLRFVKDIPIVRSDAEIPRATAIAFRSCLMAMMPKDGDPRQPRTVSDNDRIEFWVAEPGAAAHGGERGETPGKRITMLVHIGDLLGRYCEAAQPKRAAIAKQIEKETARILSSKGRKH